ASRARASSSSLLATGKPTSATRSPLRTSPRASRRETTARSMPNSAATSCCEAPWARRSRILSTARWILRRLISLSPMRTKSIVIFGKNALGGLPRARARRRQRLVCPLSERSQVVEQHVGHRVGLLQRLHQLLDAGAAGEAFQVPGNLLAHLPHATPLAFEVHRHAQMAHGHLDLFPRRRHGQQLALLQVVHHALENPRVAQASAPDHDRVASDRKSTRLNSSHVKISYA